MQTPKPVKPTGLYNKYIILDAKTGKAKKGTYFVLRLDTKSTDERCCVDCALTAYADEAQRIGKELNKPHYTDLAKGVAKMLSDARDVWAKGKVTVKEVDRTVLPDNPPSGGLTFISCGRGPVVAKSPKRKRKLSK